jgi:hypothetical protein
MSARGLLAVDPFAFFFKVIFLIAAALAIAISLKYLDIERENHGEYYALILFATMGMMFMVGAMDLITLYIGLETMAIATYVLVGFLRSSPRSNEASWRRLHSLSSETFKGFSYGIAIHASTKSGRAFRAAIAVDPLSLTVWPRFPRLVLQTALKRSTSGHRCLRRGARLDNRLHLSPKAVCSP